jgi:hypothetical protein
VWIRSLINGVSCIFSSGDYATFYPVAGNEAQKIAAQNVIKKKLKDTLIKNNNGVIQSCQEFKRLLGFDDVTFHDVEIIPEKKVILNDVLNSVVVFLEAKQKDIISSLIIPDLESYRNYISEHLFKSPFRIEKNREIKYLQSFTHFINTKTSKEYKFNVDLIHKYIVRKQNVTKELILGDIPVSPLKKASPLKKSPEKTVQRGGDKSEFYKIIKNNISKEGFLTYYTAVYLPEVLLLGYACLDVFNFNKGLKGFVNMKEINESFGSLNKDGHFDHTSKKLSDNNIITLYKIIVYIKQNMDSKYTSIFDYCYNEMLWMFDIIEKHIKQTDYKLTFDLEKQSLIIDVYKQLYDAQVYLSIRNMRENMTAIDYYESSKGFVNVHTPPKTIKKKGMPNTTMIDYESSDVHTHPKTVTKSPFPKTLKRGRTINPNHKLGNNPLNKINSSTLVRRGRFTRKLRKLRK